VSRTIEAPVALAERAFSSARARKAWLQDGGMAVRNSTPGVSLCATWVDGMSEVEVTFLDKGPGRCQVTIDHRKLAGPRDAGLMKSFWKQALERLREALEPRERRKHSRDN
jgi:hypothetical protein